MILLCTWHGHKKTNYTQAELYLGLIWMFLLGLTTVFTLHSSWMILFDLSFVLSVKCSKQASARRSWFCVVNRPFLSSIHWFYTVYIQDFTLLTLYYNLSSKLPLMKKFDKVSLFYSPTYSPHQNTNSFLKHISCNYITTNSSVHFLADEQLVAPFFSLLFSCTLPVLLFKVHLQIAQKRSWEQIFGFAVHQAATCCCSRPTTCVRTNSNSLIV